MFDPFASMPGRTPTALDGQLRWPEIAIGVARRPAPCKRKRTRPPGGGALLRAERPNQVWALDFQFDETADRRRPKLLNVVDEHTREALALRVGRTCDADQVVAVIEGLVAERGNREHLRMATGPS
jgi:putative transposase